MAWIKVVPVDMEKIRWIWRECLQDLQTDGIGRTGKDEGGDPDDILPIILWHGEPKEEGMGGGPRWEIISYGLASLSFRLLWDFPMKPSSWSLEKETWISEERDLH